MSQLENMVV
ncbi:hypothetical protein N7444_014061 (mitochondrion) [Penicillium canescens]|nr:hypothetical protein N7444_014061 [Penicillium canescens]